MAETTQPWSFTGMIADPNFQLALANMGAAADPEGTGGTIGKAAANMISSKAAQSAVEKRDKARQAQITQLIDRLGGLTPKDSPGVTSLSRTPSGGLKIDYDLPPLDTSTRPGSQTMQQATPVGTGTVLAPRETPAAIATTPAASLRATPTRQLDIADIAPFLLSPGGFEAGSLAGLNPEQVAAMGRLDTEREALRLRSVQDVIKSRETQSEIDYRLTAGELNQAQAAILRQKEPHVAAQMLAEIDQAREAAGANRALRTERETLLPIKAQQERAQTEEIQARTTSERELLQYRKQQINANIEQSLAAAGASRASVGHIAKENELLDKRIGEYVTLERGGQKYTARGIELDKEIADLQRTIISKNLEHNKRLQDMEKDDRTRVKYAGEAEGHIKRNAPQGVESPDKNKAAHLIPDIEMYHLGSDNPYVYIIEPDPGSWPGERDTKTTSYSKAVKRDLPKVDGHQYTAREIYKKANARSMTVQDYLEQIFYPMLEQPVPWYVRKDLR